MHKEVEFIVDKVGETKSTLKSDGKKIQIENTLLPHKFKLGEKIYISISSQKDNKIELLNKLLEG